MERKSKEIDCLSSQMAACIESRSLWVVPERKQVLPGDGLGQLCQRFLYPNKAKWSFFK